MSKIHLQGLVVTLFSTVAMLMAQLWQTVEIHCCFCCNPVAADSVSSREKTAWCPHCHQVFKSPLLKAPSWVTGVLAILLINLQ